jgi:hypothetical protein
MHGLLLICEICRKTLVIDAELEGARYMATQLGWRSNGEADEILRSWICPACMALVLEQERKRMRMSQ